MKQADERSFNLLRAQMLLRAATGLERTGTHGGERAQVARRRFHGERTQVKAGANSHAHVPVGVVELHLRARLDPAHHPCLVARHGRHHDPRRGFEVGRLVAKHDGRVLLDEGRAVVYGGGQVVHHDVLPLDARLVTGDALDAAHGRARKGDRQQQQQPRQPGGPGERRG